MIEKYGRLTILEVFKKNGAKYASCICDCGNKKDILLGNIKMKRTVSCGCRLKETWKEAYKHGQNKSAAYTTWENMHNRCNNKNKQCKGTYKNIEVCESWKDFKVFYQDMGERPFGMSLDRIDNTKGYFKDNCRWATRKDQQSNMSSNVWIEYNGKKKILTDWSRELGIPVTTIVGRMKVTKDTNIILYKGRLRKGMVLKNDNLLHIPLS